MPSETIEDELALLEQDEVWIQEVATHIAEEIHVDLECALAAARWASLWSNELNDLQDLSPAESADELVAYIDRARANSFARCESIEAWCCPTGDPDLWLLNATMEAFYLACGEDGDYIRSLLLREE